jgi:uncharacterized protein with beta-barrel porin domain
MEHVTDLSAPEMADTAERYRRQWPTWAACVAVGLALPLALPGQAAAAPPVVCAAPPGTPFSHLPLIVNPAVCGVAWGILRDQTEDVLYDMDDLIRRKSRDMAQAKGGAPGAGAESGFATGLSAGSEDKAWGIWFDGSGEHLNDTSAILTYSGYTATTLFGIDYNYRNDWLFGFSAGYVRTDLSVVQLAGSKLSQGAVLGPYLSYIVDQHVTIDAIFNYGRLDTSATNVASFGSNRYTGLVSVNGFADAGGFRLTGYLNYTAADEIPDAGTASLIGGQPTHVTYSAFKLGGEAAYPLGDFEPYVPLAVIGQTNDTHDGTGQVAALFGGGLRYQFSDRIKAGIQISEELRAHGETTLGSVNLRLAF